MTQEQAYATWWWEEGSGILPLPTEDMEEFTHRITQIAWSNAAYREREACAKVCELGLPIATNLNALDDMEMWGEKFAKAIRARGQA